MVKGGAVSKLEVDVPQVVGDKRKSQDGEKTNTNTKKKPYDVSGRTPLQAFNDLWHGIEFTFKQSEEKPSSFQVNAEVEGIRFEGKGTGKVQAKRDLVMKALHKLKGFAPLQPNTSTYPITTEAVSGGKQRSGNNNNLSAGLLDNLPTIDVDKVRCGPAMMLTQVFNEAELTFTEELAARAGKRFKVEMDIIGRKFFGEGRNKKAARLNLAKTVFLVLYNINDFEVVDETRSNDKDEDSPAIKKSKFPLTQLKEMIGDDDLKIDIEDFDEDNGDKKFHATVTVKGVEYQAIGDNKFTAKIRAAKKALGVLKQTTKFVNTHGVDVGVHPSLAYQQHFPDFPIIETEGKNGTGQTEYNFEVNINNKSYKVSASGRKKGKLRLILNVFESVKKTAPSEWKNIDLEKVYEDKTVHKAVSS